MASDRPAWLERPEQVGASKPLRARRVPLGRTPRRLSFEVRLRMWLVLLAVPFLLCLTGWLLSSSGWSSLLITGVVAGALLGWAAVTAVVFDRVVRPLQTLSNIVVAMREDDFSFRARGARRGDALGDLALEINALAAGLQGRRSEARDAVSLAERVISSMLSPVIAFDEQDRLRLMNASAERTFAMTREDAIGRVAEELGLQVLRATPDGGVLNVATQETDDRLGGVGAARWAVRRTAFRLRGVPHTLYVLSDVDAALREEERQAFQRLIRVLGHEINNSLTPIKSIAETLRSRLPKMDAETLPPQQMADFARGLTIIEERSASLNRFLQAYQQISRLPIPLLKPVSLPALVEQAVRLETQLRVEVEGGPDVTLPGDADQLLQLFINLLRNAVEAAMSRDEGEAQVSVAWSLHADAASVRIRDNGPGLANPKNLFVPFYTTKANGTGIGLVLAQQIASGHRGTVRLMNRKDEAGCDAEVRLPLHG